MLDDARLKALQRVAEAKEAVDEALASVKNAAEARPLEELRNCLEEIEGDLVITALDQRIAELQAYQQRLLEIDARLEKKAAKLKQVARKVATVAKAIGVVVDVAGKVVTAV